MSEIELNPKIFAVEKVKPEVIHQVVVAKLANRRRPIASTKTRGQVRGGGKKPWKQKGTGNARAGSIRSPLWRGGGITFGPTSARNFSKKLNKAMIKSALLAALTDKAQGNKIFVMEGLALPSGKTKELASKLADLARKFSSPGRTLIVTGQRDEKLELASRNLPDAKVCLASGLDILDIVNAAKVVMTKDALPVLEKAYLRTQEPKN
ncbi:MAG: 50S ribosomal protein L4 [Candidatus Doudnabacteria bacterium]|nr:50S ribosomal protein L4 [Candidatus Doudnabacteria bacterium]